VDKHLQSNGTAKQATNYLENTMSVIQSFKKRQLKKQVEQKEQVEKAIDKNAHDQKENEPENTVLSLLAKLLNVAEQDAISEATKYIESNITFFAEAEKEQVKEPSTAETVQSAASDVESSAENVNSAASKVEDASDNLAYSASDIANATEELKEAASDIKKPSEEEQKSSNGENKNKPKKSSKK